MDLTYYECLSDATPTVYSLTWEEIVELFRDQSRAMARGKADHPCFTPGQVVGRRALENVRGLDGIACDIDLAPDHALFVPFDAMVARLSASGLSYLAYTTASSREGADRYRIVFPFARRVSADRWAGAWAAVDGRLGGGRMDPATKDACRLSIMPGDFGHGCRFAACLNGGTILSADDIKRLPVSTTTTAVVSSSSGKVLDRISATNCDGAMLGYGADWSGYAYVRDWRTSTIIPDMRGVSSGRTYIFIMRSARKAERQRVPVDADSLAVLATQYRAISMRKSSNHGDLVRQAENALAVVYSTPSK